MTDIELKRELKNYSLPRWKKTLHDLFGERFKILTAPQQIPLPADFVIECQQFGYLQLDNKRQIALLDTRVKDNKQIAINRVELRNVVQRVIDQDKFHGILVVYHNDNQTTYRLSFISRSTNWSDEEGDWVETQTNPRRFTYVLGGNEAGTTAAQRLLTVANKNKIELKDFFDAFAVENLNSDFFKRYNDFYREFTQYLTIGGGSHFRQSVFGLSEASTPEQRDRDEKPIRDFVKKLLGRIVFLHFLQKKGWMGVPTPSAGKPVVWKNGRVNFLKDLFDEYNAKGHFHSRCLTELFYNTLNKDQDARPDYVFRVNGKAPFGEDVSVPYLNGGLFDNDLAASNSIDFPAEYFKRLLEFFCEYNFTIDENNPDEHEVGIDPEMLGHIFENLLEENREKGTFYTPKEVVQYMCQESLIQYLVHHMTGRLDSESQVSAQAAIEALIRQGDKGDTGSKANFVQRNARRIEELLDKVTICDPAIGSGAFPMGMLQTIYHTKLTLDWTLNPGEVKKGIIERSIYGVDIEPGAVDIARLRFWLSIVVDEEVEEGENPSPLPNLDYKIMQGDSLLETFEGIRLDNLLTNQVVDYVLENGQIDLFGKVADPQIIMSFTRTQKQELHDLLDLYFDPEKLKTRRLKKEAVRKDIDDMVHSHIEYNFELAELSLERRIGEAGIQIADLEKSIRNNPNESAVKRRQKETSVEQLKKQKERSQKELDTVRARKERLYNIAPNNKPYFLWHLFFQDVFKQGGFDIVIGNPPYVRIQSLDKLAKQFYQQTYSGTAMGNYDIYILFTDLGLRLLKEGGTLTYIQPNKFFNADYGEGLRRLLTTNQWLHTIVNFRAEQVFNSATTYTCILLCQKQARPAFRYIQFKGPQKTQSLTFRAFADGFYHPEYLVREELPADNYSSGPWSFGEGNETRLFNKMETGALLLSKIAKVIFVGLQTSADGVYILEKRSDGRYYSKHLDQCVELEDDLLKPLLKGAEIRRYQVDFQNYWLIFPYRFTDKGVKLIPSDDFAASYPLTWAYFLDCQDKLRGRESGKMDHAQWYAYVYPKNLDQFEQLKIMTQVLANRASMVLDTQERFYFVGGGNAGGYGITLRPDSDLNLRYVLGLLNSQLLDFYLQRHSGLFNNNYFSYAKRFLANLPIKAASTEVQNKIEALVDRIQQQKAHNPASDVMLMEAQIDALVFQLYEFTESEVAYVLTNSINPLSEAYIAAIQNQFRNLQRGHFQIVI